MSERDEQFYAFVVEELKSGEIKQGAWAKALALSDFDKNAARGVYVQIRVEQLKSQSRISISERVRAFLNGYDKGVREYRHESRLNRHGD